MVWDFNRSIS